MMSHAVEGRLLNGVKALNNTSSFWKKKKKNQIKENKT